MDFNLAGRVAVITGPAKGMGAAITKAFAAEGRALALIGRDIAAIEPVADEARAAGAEAIVVPCDLTDAKQCERAAAATRKTPSGASTFWSTSPAAPARSARPASRPRRTSSTTSSRST